MAQHDSAPQNNPAGRRSPGIFLLLAVLFGLSMAAVGFLAGRATASPGGPAPVAAVDSGAVAELASPTPTPLPSATPPVATDTVAPPATPTAADTATPPSPTPEPAALEVAPAPGSPLQGADFGAFYEVWNLIGSEFDGSVPSSEEVIQEAIAGSLGALDDNYTRYVPPAVAERMRQEEDGAVEGIGAMVRENEDGLFEIVRPIDGQPADLAGLLPGDVLIEVDGQSVLEIGFDEVIMMVRGPAGTTVRLKVAREGEAEPLEFAIVRARFEVPVLEFEMLPPEITGGAPIGYIRLTEFSRNADEKLREALDAILPQQPAGLVFDLRDNPGGYLDQSVAVADAFLPAGVALYERNNRGLDQTFVTRDGDAAEAIPLVVLVNAGSASASEIVAGAIQDRGRGVLVGETTFGKGSVQQIHPLSNNAELRVTVARWYTPNNNTIDGQGITPDFAVESPADLGGADDGQLLRAVEYLLTSP